jgi:prepilin-type processing-associated H-X9-DG protein
MSPSSFYSGAPYNNYLDEYVATSYDMNFQAYNIQPCWLCNCGAGNPSDCTARKFLTPTWPGATTGNSLVIMDNAMSNFDPVMTGSGYYDYNCIGWHTPCFWGPTFGMNYGTGNIVSILNEPGHMHAFRHPGYTANGLFLDGHVETVKPYELTPKSAWPHLNIWKKNGVVSEWYSNFFP